MTRARYAFDNDDPEAVDRHRHLATILDGPTTTRIADALGEVPGRRCLELGAGGGSVAKWLAERGARVLATDLNVRHLPAGAGYEVLRHDLVTEPLPAGEWDLIHARLLLMHLPRRHEILPRLAAALAPGGVLLLEDFATTFRHGVLAAPTPADAAAYDEHYAALVERVLPECGTDPTWALQAHAAMLAAGLASVDTQVYARSWPGGTAGALLITANIAQQRERFRRAGVSDETLERVVSLMSDPRMVVRGHLIYSTAGRRPGP
jgi:SAM-dependent methyltransferase